MHSRKLSALIGMLFVAFPSAFSTLVFRYTAVYYGIAIFLSVAAAWVLHRWKYGLVLSALCTACSLGIYQAYAPITIGLFVLILLRETLSGSSNLPRLIRDGVYDCAALLLGLLFYYILLKAFLHLYGTTLSDYQGVNEMGALSLAELPQLIKEAVYSVIMLPFKDYCGLASSRLIKIAYLLLGGVSILLVAYLSLKYVRKLAMVLFAAILCLAFPVAVNFVVIMCPDSWIYTLMVCSFVLVGCVPAVLLDILQLKEGTEEHKTAVKAVAVKGTMILLAILIGSYSYQANVNYTALYYSNRQIENYLSSLVSQVRMTDGFSTEMDWAFIGEIEDPLLHCYWEYEMSYGGIEFTEWMLQRYSWQEWIRNYYGYSVPVADEEVLTQLASMKQVQDMPCWPNEGSIKIVDNTIVIKFQEVS